MFIGSLGKSSRKLHSSEPLFPQGRSREDTQDFMVDLYWDLLPTLSKVNTTHFQRGMCLILSHSSAMGLASTNGLTLPRRQKNAFSSGSPITSVKTQLIQLGFSTWPKGAWENSGYFLTSLVKLPRAITSEMAGQGCLDSLQTWMDIWIIMGSQFGPLVKVFLGHIVACLITVLSSIAQFSFTERKYAKDYTLPSPLDKYFVMDQTALAGLLGYLQARFWREALMLQILKIQDRIAWWTLQRSLVIRKTLFWWHVEKRTMLASISSSLERHELPLPSHFPTFTPPLPGTMASKTVTRGRASGFFCTEFDSWDLTISNLLAAEITLFCAIW